jgi:hypothetical protein
MPAYQRSERVAKLRTFFDDAEVGDTPFEGGGLNEGGGLKDIPLFWGLVRRNPDADKPTVRIGPNEGVALGHILAILQRQEGAENED